MKTSAAAWIVALASLFALGACAAGDDEQEQAEIAAAVLAARIPDTLTRGAALFEVHCASCHGDRALGTDVGPPLVHRVYEPAHHGDIAFIMAVERGVRAHHWRFGDMPPVPGLDRGQVNEITAYVRHLQRLVGID